MMPMGMPQLPPLPDWLQKMDSEDMEELMENPTWEEVEQLLTDDITLSYKIDIETDSTIKVDQEADKAARIEFLDAAGKFLQAAMSNQNPDLAPLLGKLLEFGVRGFKIGKELETAFEVAIHKLEKDASDPSKQKPNPEVMKIQGEQQIAQQRMQADIAIEQQKSQDEQKRLQLQAQVDAHQGQVDAEVEKMKVTMQGQLDMARAKLESETKIIVAQIQAKASIKQAAMSKSADETLGADPSYSGADLGDGGSQATIADLIGTVVTQLKQTLDGMQQGHQAIAQGQQQMAQAMSKPRQVMRDEQGNITGVQ